MYKSLPFFIAATLLFTSCKKLQTQQDSDAATCANISNITITSNSPVNIGDPIKFSVPEVGGYRIYNWNGTNNFQDQYPDHIIDYAELKHEGWYYGSVSNNSCETKIDSVYSDVKLLQGTPACNVTTNAATYSNLADDTYNYRRKGIESTYRLLSLEGSGNGNLTVYFHPEWRTKEPEDGIYTTTNVPLFDQVDYVLNSASLKTIHKSALAFGYVLQKCLIDGRN
jgi:hypothetical protein